MKVPETFFSVSEEAWLFLLSCALGAAMGAFYEIFRTVRTVLPHNAFLVAVEDVFFIICWGGALTAFSSACALGQLRGYFVLGSILGAALYLATLGRIISGAVRKAACGIRTVLKVFLMPIKRCCVFIRAKATVKFVGSSKIFVNSIKKVEILLPKALNLLYNKTENNKRKNVKNVGRKKKNTEKKRAV